MQNLDARLDYVRERVKVALEELDRLPPCDKTNAYTRRAAKQLRHAASNLYDAAMEIRYWRGKAEREAARAQDKQR